MKAGIIIPFRDTFNTGERFQELNVLRLAIDNNCRKHKQDYQIYVIWQNDDQLFNIGSLINVGVDISKNECDYFIKHDVDNIPVSDDNVYRNRKVTGNICGKINDDSFTDKDNHFGDVVFFKKADYFAINGISNYYWGWGFEVSATPSRLKSLDIPYGRGDSEFKTMVHETKHRFNGNPNFVNNVLLYHFFDIQVMEGYKQNKYEIDYIENMYDRVIVYKVDIGNPQYNVNEILTPEDLRAMGGIVDESVYNWVLETYKK